MKSEPGNLSVEKRALLAARLREKGKAPSAVAVIPRLSRGDGAAFPLSFAQERLWLLEQMEPGGAAYCIPFAFRMTGALDRAALECALDEVVRRHEVLRATFKLVDGHPVQVIAPLSASSPHYVDLRSFPSDERDAEMARVTQAEARRTFDLERGPLLRAMLLRLDDAEHVLFMTVHHIVVDAWSAGIFGRELATCYRAIVAGEQQRLPELPVQYVDFAAWQRSRLQGETLADLTAYWEKQLRGAPPVLELPADHPRPPVQSYRGATQPFALSGALAESLRALSRQAGVTLFMTLLAAFDVLLYRYTGQPDVVVGTPTANRNRAELADLIGFFVNTLVLRCDLSGNPTFRELLGRVRATALGGFAHQDMPFEALVEALHPARDPSRNPLFQVMFILQNIPQGAAWEFPELTLSQFEFAGETAQFDLLLSLAETAGGLSGQVTYSADLFTADTAARMAGHFQTLLAAVVAAPNERLLALPLLTESERQTLRGWNATAVDYSDVARLSLSDWDTDDTDATDRKEEKIHEIRAPFFRAFAQNPQYTLHELFEAQVARTPDAPAVIFEGRALTYAGLNRQADALAHYLRTLGVGPETLVGVCMERSPELVAALYGVLKAGAAYVPLDPAYPKERLAFMLDDAQTGVLLTQPALAPALPEYAGQVFCLDQGALHLAAPGADAPAARALPDNLAYMIYTSGSTGRPKGALNTHRAIVNRLLWMQDAYGLTPEDRVLQKTPFSFDVSVWEFFWPLSTGACLVLARPEGHKDNAYLIQTIRREGITTLHFVPSMLQLFLAEPEVELCRSLRRVICSGETLSLEAQTRFFERLGGVELHNLYGPTEAAVDVTSWRCERDSELHTVPIGRPIANLHIHLLDACMQPVPVGVPGELYIGGVGLARGYHRRPGLTAEKFVPDSVGLEPGRRLYRTGDLARYLPSGAIEFLQRLDDQVKVRGFRIELGEIETTLRAHPSVGQAAVTTYTAAPGDKRLVAYLVLADQQTTVSDLRAFLGERLPGYMIPSIFMLLDSLPLSPNGKLDRRALPAPEGERPVLETAFVAPRTAAERTLAAIWQEALGLERVGVHDNFFELGGDSLLTLRVLAQAKAAGLILTPRQFFQNQTVAALAAVAGAAAENTGAAAPDADVSAAGALPLTPGQAWFFRNDFPDPHWWTMGQMFKFKYHPSAPVWLRQALRSLLEHHDGLRARFIRDESGWHAWIPPYDAEAAVPLTVVDFADVPKDERPARLEALAAEAHQSLALTDGPLVRLLLVDSGAPNPYHLLVVLHHLVSDEVSLGIVLQDLWTAYAQLVQEQLVALPPKTLSLRRWAAHLHVHAQSPGFAQQMAEWQALLWSEVAPLPLDDPAGRSKNTWDSQATVWASLTDAETHALLHDLARTARPLDALLAALVKSVSRWTGKRWVAVNTIDSGRLLELPGAEDADLSRTVGWLAGGGILPLECPDTDDAGAMLRSICDQVRRFPAYGIPIEMARLSADYGPMAGLPAHVYDLKLNYAGRVAQGAGYPAWVRPALTSLNNTRNPACLEPALLTCAAAVMGNRLCCTWNFSRNVYKQATVEALSAEFMRELRRVLILDF